MNFVALDYEKMVQAIIYAQGWLRPSNRLDMDDYLIELRDLDKGNVQFFFSFLTLFIYFIGLLIYMC